MKKVGLLTAILVSLLLASCDFSGLFWDDYAYVGGYWEGYAYDEYTSVYWEILLSLSQDGDYVWGSGTVSDGEVTTSVSVSGTISEDDELILTVSEVDSANMVFIGTITHDWLQIVGRWYVSSADTNYPNGGDFLMALNW